MTKGYGRVGIPNRDEDDMSDTTITKVDAAEEPEDNKPIVLTYNDQCDVRCPAIGSFPSKRCPAAAQVLVGKGELTPLLFCNHHYKERQPLLLGQGWLVIPTESITMD